MELVFESTERFEKDLDRLSDSDQRGLTKRINLLFQLLKSDRGAFFQHAKQPLPIQLGGDLEASLYVLRLNSNLRLIATVDDDPLFGRTVITLLRIVRKSNEAKAFGLMMKSLYQEVVAETRQKESNNG